jgi:phosphoribosylaminoimidazole (AIR) synthetase
MESTFNNGLGMIAVVPAAEAAKAAEAIGGHVVGTVVDGAGVELR